MYLRKIVSSILAFLLFSIMFLKATQAQNIPIVANVNNEDISLETMIHAMNELPPEIQSQPFMSYYEDLLERVIDIKLFAQEGKKIWNTIEGLINEWKPDQLLVGNPLNMDGTPSDMIKKIDPFFKKLQMISNLPCELVDERLTSFEAKQLAQKNKRDDRIDDLAAKIFLDNWIEHHVNSK